MKKLIFLLAIQILWGLTGYSQGCCSGGAPLAGSLGLQDLAKGDVLIAVSFRHNHLTDLMIEREVLDDKRITRTVQSLVISGQYAVTNRLTLSLILPWLRQREALTGTNEQAIADGPGDGTLMVQYQFLSKKDWTAIGGLGTKAPTGITSIVNNLGILLNPNIQPGTGAWEGLGALYLRRGKFLRPTMSVEMIGSYRLMGTGDRFGRLQRYRFGDERQVYLGISDQYFMKKFLMDVSLGFRFRQTQTDLVNEVPVPNTGGNWLYFSPGINIYITPSITWGTGMNYPLYRSLTGTQLTTSWTLQSGISIRN